eukprot:5786771-Karenia_brevis.AAC.1
MLRAAHELDDALKNADLDLFVEEQNPDTMQLVPAGDDEPTLKKSLKRPLPPVADVSADVSVDDDLAGSSQVLNAAKAEVQRNWRAAFDK